MKKSRPIQNIEIENLYFDPQNPRLPHDIDGSNDEVVLEFLITNGNVDDLMKSIGSQGYFPGEPLLVVPKNNRDEYFVIEGNRRLGALKLLSGITPPRKPGTIAAILAEVEFTPEAVPCIVFEKREDILGYLGYRHITGIKEWNHLAKARYLKQLYTKYSAEFVGRSPQDIYSILAKNIGSRSDHVYNLLNGLEVIDYAENKGILVEIDRRPNDLYFSLLTTALNTTSVRNYIHGGTEIDRGVSIDVLDPLAVKNLFVWLYGEGSKDSVIIDSRNIRKLSKILSDTKASAYFMRNISEPNILEISYNISGGMLDAFDKLIRNIMIDTQNLQKIYLDVYENITQEEVDRLDRVSNEFRIFCRGIKKDFEEKSEE